MDGGILDRIDGPSDLRSLDREALIQLASEIRETLVATVSETGGHLAPNLGVVELTIALHRALDSPKDKIVWDVGHQCYVHKLLTGRRAGFGTLRQQDGIAGFPKRSESEHDVFDSGHASNSLSVALGLAEARDKSGRDETVVAVIGDGSLTGGMAYEALNQAGHLQTRLVVILNDNEMSIATNVGAMSSYLARVRLDPAYNKVTAEIEQRIRKIPAIGERMFTMGGHVKESLKALLVPGMLFEELGFKYIGPIDGHDVQELERNISLAKLVERPVLLHVLTKKGHGYEPAELNPGRFHGTPPFLPENGEVRSESQIPTYTQVFGDAICELADGNPKLIAVTAAMTSGTGLEKFSRQFPERFYDVGIAEQHAVTFCAGLALGGLVPVAAIYSTFLQRAFDQLIEDICLQGVHVVFAIDRAGVVGEDGPTHHGVFDLAYLRQMPGMVVMAPKDEAELRDMVYTAVMANGPVAVRYPRDRGLGVALREAFSELVLGEAEVLREGREVCILAVGRMVREATEAARLLSRRGIQASVVNARFVKPIDAFAVAWAAREHELVVTVEEGCAIGGFGTGVLETLTEARIDAQVLHLAIPDRFVEHGSMKALLGELGLDAKGIAYSIGRRLSRASGRGPATPAEVATRAMKSEQPGGGST